MRKAYTDNLPRHETGANKNKIDWKNSKKYKFKFIYDDIEGEIEIIDYTSKGQQLKIKYNDKYFEIKTTDILQCKLGRIVERRTKEFKIEIGTRFQDEKRDIIITDRKYEIKNISKTAILNEKMYKFHCNICNFDGGEYYDSHGKYYKEYWIKERSVTTNGYGCPCCANQIIAEHINSIVATDSWMIKFFQGGYDEAKKYTHQSGHKINPLCPDCSRIKDTKVIISNIYKRHSISCFCSDNIPYPEKFMFNILERLHVNFKTQLSKVTFDWITDDKRYDFAFVLNNEQYIIETHGKQHYEDCGWCKAKDVQENDRFKKQLALNNGIKEENYIIINCRYSNLEWIRNSILQDKKMNELFNLVTINWLKAEEFACGTRVKEACELKRNNPELTTTDIAEIMKMSKTPVTDFLKKGDELGWCHYNPQEEKFKSSSKCGGNKGKPVEVFKDEISLGKFPSARYIETHSEELFGVKLDNRCISEVCNNKRKSHRGFVFRFI